LTNSCFLLGYVEKGYCSETLLIEEINMSVAMEVDRATCPLAKGDRVEASRYFPFGEFGSHNRGDRGVVTFLRPHGEYEVHFDGDLESIIVSRASLTYICSGIEPGQEIEFKVLVAVVVADSMGYQQIQEIKPGTRALVEQGTDASGLAKVLFNDGTPVLLKAEYLEVVLSENASAVA
jgi:hypothetical protein